MKKSLIFSGAGSLRLWVLGRFACGNLNNTARVLR